MTPKTIETTFEIIDNLIELEGAGVTELAEEMNKPTSTTHDYLNALAEGGYVLKEGQTYRVSTRFLYLGLQARSQRKVYNTARNQIQNLADVTGEYASLVIEEQGYGVLLYTVGGDKAVDIDTPGGVRTTLHSSAPGKSILAHLPDDRVEEILQKHGLEARTPKTITDKSVLNQNLTQIRDQGYALDEEEHFEGMQGVGIPVIGATGNVRGAISVYGPIGRTGNQETRQIILEAISEAVNVIEVNLKYPGRP